AAPSTKEWVCQKAKTVANQAPTTLAATASVVASPNVAARRARIGNDSNRPSSTATAPTFQWSGSLTIPVQTNLGWREASNTPQYMPTPPSWVFDGWWKASMML